MTEAKSEIKILNYIGGKHCEPSTGAFLPIYEPATGIKVGVVCDSSKADVDAAVEAASHAFKGWSALTSKARVQCLYKLRSLVIEHADELADLIVKEHGKTKAEALGEVSKGNETIEWACSYPQVSQGKMLEVSTGVYCHEIREPLGVVAHIVPFNFPFMVPCWTLPIALAAGNAVIIKPSEKVPRTLDRFMALLQEAGFPKDLVNIVNGRKDVVEAICTHPKISAVSFVGSSKVAQIVNTLCHTAPADSFSNSMVPSFIPKRCLALGAAKNHLIALDDCNPQLAASDIVVSFTGCAGQRCMAASVLLLVGEQPKLLDLIVEKASSMKLGQENGQLPPLIDQAAVDRCKSYLDEAEKAGAKILLDGRKAIEEKKEGFWFGASVILHSSPNDRAMKEEIFGPILSVYVCKTMEESLAIQQSCLYGNAACIYTSSGSHAEWFSKRFTAGMIGINVGVPVPREPFSFGGFNASKFGDLDVTGEGAMNFFSKVKKVTTKWNPPVNKSNADWMS